MLHPEDGPQTPEEAAREFDIEPVTVCPACGFEWRERRCVRCGVAASEAAGQNEPICSDGGFVAAHSYRDVPVEMWECPQCGETPASMRAQGWRP